MGGGTRRRDRADPCCAATTGGNMRILDHSGAAVAALVAFLTFAGAAGAREHDLNLRDGFDAGSLQPASRGEAARFLTQATFGPSEAAIDELADSDYDRWIDQQIALPATYALPYMRSVEGVTDPLAHLPFHRYRQAWFVAAASAPDQLRQRVAFALSEILVVSERGNTLGDDGLALGAYHDILVRDAFGTYRQLLEDVTLSPAMGRYLSMYRNRKPDAANNIQADENYAREVMQLFSIGLVKLNPDGSPVLVNGATVPTYDGSVVRALARVFTGWACHCAAGQDCSADPFVVETFTCSTEHAMVPYEAYHDRDEKRLFDGIVLGAGRDARSDLASALDALAQHPNVGPFLGRQLIQRLVTSNPSPAYVARVAQVFADDGHGVRGNLGAVVRAILLDPEARVGHRLAPATFGKVREPLLRVTALWRAFDVTWQSDTLFPDDREIHESHNQSPLYSPSVFNFFSPRHAPAGTLAGAGLVAPEMQIVSANFAIRLANDVDGRVFYGYAGGELEELDPGVRVLHLERWRTWLATTGSGALIGRLDELLLGGGMSPALRQLIATRLAAIPASDTLARVQNAVYLIATSPEFATQR
jgi:uncharacterized protein (DUF1800 family)